MPVLYGVFLYMGVSSLKGIQVNHHGNNRFEFRPGIYLNRFPLMLLPMQILCSVLRPSEAVRHAPQAPTRLYLPAPRPPEEGSPVHCHPAHVPGAALGHQDITRRYCFPHDGKFTNTFPPYFPANVNNIHRFFPSACRFWLWSSSERSSTYASPTESSATWTT